MNRRQDIQVLDNFLAEPVSDTTGIFQRFGDLLRAFHWGNGLAECVYVPRDGPNKVLLVAHADTYWDKEYLRGNAPVGIGADDRAGCAMLWQLRLLGHSLLVVHGEEGGSVGARNFMDWHAMANDIPRHQFVIEFDRRGSSDFKCYDVGTPAFREYVHRKTGYTEPDRLSSTDITVLCREICGVNLSVGYYDEHTSSETINMDEWEATLNICRDWLSAPDLPQFRR